MDWQTHKEEIDRHITRDDDVEDGPEVKLCPFRFSVGENIGYECIGSECALFVNNQCAVVLLAINCK